MQKLALPSAAQDERQTAIWQAPFPLRRMELDTRSAVSHLWREDEPPSFERAAFSKGVAGGRFLPDRLDRTYGALAREAGLKTEPRKHHNLRDDGQYVADGDICDCLEE